MGIDSAFQEAKMKIRAVILMILFSSLKAWSMDADFLGYLRGGTGLNLEGGKQECFSNAGIPGNFLRLGNECSFYSELGVIFHHKKPSELDPVYFKTQVRIQFGAQGTRQWETAANRDINQVEAFVMGGGFTEILGDFWIGKRFYRDVDLYIFDWYYYAELSGVGAGVENIPLGTGKFSIAHLIQTNETVQTSNGRPALQAIDLRWKEVPLSEKHKLNLWGVYAAAPGGRDDANTTHYQATQGASIATRIESSLDSGTNNLSLMYGYGAMKDFNIYGSSAVAFDDNSQNKAWNIRFVEDWRQEVKDRWGFYLGIAAEFGDSGAPQHSRKEWQEIGIRPIYFVSDRFQWVFETGFSRIKDESERNGTKALGERTLTRATFGPQLSFNKSIWGRPVMRAFVSRSSWNRDNRASIRANAPTFGGRLEGTSLGYQFEAWF